MRLSRVLVVSGLALSVLAANPAFAVQLNLGDVLIADDPFGSTTPARILRFNPTTGASDVISSGGFLDFLSDVTVDNQGHVLAMNILAGLVRINPADGSQSVIASGFFQEGFGAPIGMTVAPSGNILVSTNEGKIVQVDPSTGAKVVVAALPTAGAGVARHGDDLFIVSNPLQRFNITAETLASVPAGGLFSFPYRIAVDQTGYGYVVDFDNGLMGVDLVTGEERFVSSGKLVLDLVDVGINGVNNRPIGAIRSGEIIEIDPDNFGEQILLTAPGQQLGSNLVAMEIVTVVPAPGALAPLLIASGVILFPRRRF